MNDIFVPVAASETACMQRENFSARAVETALAGLLESLSPEIAFAPGGLTDKLDGIGVSLTGFADAKENFPGGFPVTITLNGRSADPAFCEQFARIAAVFPREHDTLVGVYFGRIERKSEGEFGKIRHHGTPKQSAKLVLSCQIDLARSSFTPGETEAIPTVEDWSKIPFAAVENGVAALLGVRAGTLREEEEGSAVRVTGSAGADDLRYRDFSLKLTVRTAGCSNFERELARLLSMLPAIDVSQAGVEFNAIYCEEAMEFTHSQIFEREYGCGTLTLTARVDVAMSQGASNSPVSSLPDRSVTAFDPALLERSLSERVGSVLGLESDRECCRGEFPPPGSGVKPIASVKLTGINSGNRHSGFHIQALLQIRTPHRDELFQKILRLDSLFPQYDKTLGGVKVRAMLKREFKLEWKEENGRNMLNALLSLELIL
ncbi:MAG: hypothetical protein LBM70_09260 [Victivallales bacterium]|jgi:hypothetical protein|nr:hypothetical protein [Victivallales bacterium]